MDRLGVNLVPRIGATVGRCSRLRCACHCQPHAIVPSFTRWVRSREGTSEFFCKLGVFGDPLILEERAKLGGGAVGQEVVINGDFDTEAVSVAQCFGFTIRVLFFTFRVLLFVIGCVLVAHESNAEVDQRIFVVGQVARKLINGHSANTDLGLGV